MKNPDRGTSLFWLGLAVFAFIESLGLGIGTPRNPGMGFLSGCASALLGLLSLGLFVKSTIGKGVAGEQAVAIGRGWIRLSLVTVSLVMYVVVLPYTGYLVGTFCLMAFTFRLAGFRKLRWVFFSSFVTAAVTYFVFSFWLNCQFPTGLLGI